MKVVDRIRARRMTDREVLVQARAVQEERGYSFFAGAADGTGRVCPAAAIAVVLGRASFQDALDHPAAKKLAVQFDDKLAAQRPDGSLSQAVARSWDLTTPQVLSRFDAAIAEEE